MTVTGAPIVTDQRKALLFEAELSASADWIHVQADAPGAGEVLANLDLDAWVVDALTAPESRPRTLCHAEGVNCAKSVVASLPYVAT